MQHLPFAPNAPWLAPLAGWSDLAFRLLCREYGARVCCTEMISAKGLVYNSKGTKDLLHTIAQDTPLVVQLFGNEPQIMASTLRYLLEQGFTWFDLNMGCAVPKVTRTGCGAAMLKDIPHALAVARKMIALAGEGRVGFKLRLGWDDTSPVWEYLALQLQNCGAGWITLHPRTARQGFSGEARWPALQRLAESLDIPVMGSGDLLCAEDGVRCLHETGVQGIMYARGALRDPAIFTHHQCVLRGETSKIPSRQGLLRMIRRHAALAEEHCVHRVALLKMRTFVPRYVRHLSGARHMRQALSRCMDWMTFYAILEDFFAEAEEA